MIELTNPTARIENLNSDDYQAPPSQDDYKYLSVLESGDIKSYEHNPVIGLDEFLLLYFGFNIPVSEKGVNAALNIVSKRFNFLPLIKNDIEQLATANGLIRLNKITKWLALCSELNLKPCEAVVMAFQGQATQAESASIENDTNPPSQILDNKNTLEKKQGRRDQQINFIIETAQRLNYELLAIPEGGKQAIKAECLKNKALFTDDGFKKAWTEANSRNITRMVDKEKYL